MFEKTKGGAGNIAIFAGRVIKFNTHSSGAVTDDMKRCCDALRQKLDQIAAGLLRDSGVTNAEFEKEIASIRAKLGLSADGMKVVSANSRRNSGRRIRMRSFSAIRRRTRFPS